MSYNKEMVKLPFHLSSTPASYMKVEVKHAHFGTNERKWSASSSSCFNHIPFQTRGTDMVFFQQTNFDHESKHTKMSEATSGA